MKMKNYIGTVLSFNESDCNLALRALSSQLDNINQIGNLYIQLDSTFEFNQEVYNRILQSGIADIETRYREQIELQIKALKFTSPAIVSALKQNITSELLQLSERINIFLGTQRQPGGSVLNLTLIKIVDGQAVLPDESKEALRESFTTRIRTEHENQLYNHLINLKASYEQLTAYMVSQGCNFNRWGYIISDRDNGLAYESNGKMEIMPEALTMNLAIGQ